MPILGRAKNNVFFSAPGGPPVGAPTPGSPLQPHQAAAATFQSLHQGYGSQNSLNLLTGPPPSLAPPPTSTAHHHHGYRSFTAAPGGHQFKNTATLMSSLSDAMQGSGLSRQLVEGCGGAANSSALNKGSMFSAITTSTASSGMSAHGNLASKNLLQQQQQIVAAQQQSSAVAVAARISTAGSVSGVGAPGKGHYSLSQQPNTAPGPYSFSQQKFGHNQVACVRSPVMLRNAPPHHNQSAPHALSGSLHYPSPIQRPGPGGIAGVVGSQPAAAPPQAVMVPQPTNSQQPQALQQQQRSNRVSLGNSGMPTIISPSTNVLANIPNNQGLNNVNNKASSQLSTAQQAKLRAEALQHTQMFFTKVGSNSRGRSSSSLDDLQVKGGTGPGMSLSGGNDKSLESLPDTSSPSRLSPLLAETAAEQLAKSQSLPDVVKGSGGGLVSPTSPPSPPPPTSATPLANGSTLASVQSASTVEPGEINTKSTLPDEASGIVLTANASTASVEGSLTE